MRVLVACEFSGVVTTAFRKRGHEAYSCDILPAEYTPTFHYQADVLDILGAGWDLMIAHPPCTHLAVSGARWFKDKAREQQEALDFVWRLWLAPIKNICIENPISVISTYIAKPSQIIQPWQFGHPESKATCLWLRGLPLLRPTNVLTKEGKRWSNQTPSGQNRLGPSPDRWKKRSVTYAGIADAMAEQWGKL